VGVMAELGDVDWLGTTNHGFAIDA
jgi:hypothetical protein